MSKLNATQIAILSAFSQYKTGSTAVVRAFEKAVSDYWNVDSTNPQNLAFFLNASKRFPVLQKAAVKLLSRKDAKSLKDGGALAYLQVKLNRESGEYEITTITKDITKQMKAQARMNVKDFIACEYNSLLQETKIAKAVAELSFDKEATAKAISQTIQNQIKNMIAVQGGVNKDVMRRLVNEALDTAFSEESITKAKTAAAKLKAA